jgi:hypothetical protein
MNVMEKFMVDGRKRPDPLPLVLRHIVNLPGEPSGTIEHFVEEDDEGYWDGEEDDKTTSLADIMETMSMKERNAHSTRHASGVQYVRTAYRLKKEALDEEGLEIAKLRRDYRDVDFLNNYKVRSLDVFTFSIGS